MVMPSNLAHVVVFLHPTAVPLEDFEVVNDRAGVRIAHWNVAKLGPQPDEATILAAKPAADAAASTARDRQRQAIQFLKSFNHQTATASEVRTAVGALILVVKNLMREDA